MLTKTSVTMSIEIVISLLMLFVVGAVSAEAGPAVDVEARNASSLAKVVRGYGRKMSKAEAASLEQALKKEPDDLNARAKLLGYYFYQGLKQEGAAATIKARRRHITWLISNHPNSRIAGLPEATIDSYGHSMADRTGYETASSMWRALAERKGVPRQTLENAFNFLRFHDKAEAEKIAKRVNDPYLLGEIYALGVVRVSTMNQNGLIISIGSSKEDDRYARHAENALRATDDKRVIDSAAEFLLSRGSMAQVMAQRSGKTIEPKPVTFAGELLERCDDCRSRSTYYRIMGLMSRTPAEKKKFAQQELAQLEKDLSRRSQNGKNRELSLGELDDYADVAFQAGEYDKAAGYAHKVLKRVNGHPLDGMYGMTAHKGHIILGRIALLKGDVKAAGEHLLHAADVKGGATLQSFGPNMALAKELLEHGEREVVISYLERCKRFWDLGQNRLNEWIGTVKKGGMPEFGANLVY